MSRNIANTFRVHEIFHTLQGEGAHTGRAAVFCRFAGCNLWSGREEDRASALCRFCDTTFRGVTESGGNFTEDELVRAIAAAFPAESLAEARRSGETPYVVFTGGEPALQLTQELVERLHSEGFELGVESNGTLPLPAGLDWITVSPKIGVPLAVTCGHELKLVWPQEEVCETHQTLLAGTTEARRSPADFARLDFARFTLQPCDNANRDANTALCIAYCLAHPRWRLGLQCHKFIGVR